MDEMATTMEIVTKMPDFPLSVYTIDEFQMEEHQKDFLKIVI